MRSISISVETNELASVVFGLLHYDDRDYRNAETRSAKARIHRGKLGGVKVTSLV